MRLNVARENLALQHETLQITQWRVQAGLATSLDVEQARAATEQTRALIPALEARIEQTAQQHRGADRAPPAALPELACGAGEVRRRRPTPSR